MKGKDRFYDMWPSVFFYVLKEKSKEFKKYLENLAEQNDITSQKIQILPSSSLAGGNILKHRISFEGTDIKNENQMEDCRQDAQKLAKILGKEK